MIDKKQLIDDIKKGKISDEEALEILNDKGYEDVGEAVKIDFSRKSRRGFPEAIYLSLIHI